MGQRRPWHPVSQQPKAVRFPADFHRSVPSPKSSETGKALSQSSKSKSRGISPASSTATARREPGATEMVLSLCAELS